MADELKSTEERPQHFGSREFVFERSALSESDGVFECEVGETVSGEVYLEVHGQVYYEWDRAETYTIHSLRLAFTPGNNGAMEAELAFTAETSGKNEKFVPQVSIRLLDGQGENLVPPLSLGEWDFPATNGPTKFILKGEMDQGADAVASFGKLAVKFGQCWIMGTIYCYKYPKVEIKLPGE